MASRLQKLLDLLKSGSGPSRDQAARRLAEIADEQPHEFANLLLKLQPYILSHSWDTRVAAARAFSGILGSVMEGSASGVQIETGPGSGVKSEVGFDAGAEPVEAGLTTRESEGIHDGSDTAGLGLKFDFDLSTVLAKQGLLDSGAAQAQLQPAAELPGAEKALEASRKTLEKTLGLNPALGLSSADMVKDEDLAITTTADPPEVDPENSSGVPAVKKMKTEESASSVDESAPKKASEPAPQSDQVTLSSIISGYIDRALDPDWNKRHGCSLALLGFVQTLQPRPEVTVAHRKLCLKMLSTVCTVNAVDRFCDFKDSHVYFPVKENCASIIAILTAKYFTQPGDDGMLPILSMVSQFVEASRPWECRYAGLLCLKSLGEILHHGSTKFDFDNETKSLALAPPKQAKGEERTGSLKTETVPISEAVLAAIFDTLDSENDDLVRLAAEVCVLFKANWRDSEQHVSGLLTVCRRSLTACATDEFLVPPFLTLYHFLAIDGLISITDSVADLAYLLPLVHSSLVEVRKQSLELLKMKACDSALTKGLCGESLLILMRILFQRLLCEPKSELQHLVAGLWGTLVATADPDALKSAVCPFFGCWLSFLMISPAEPMLDPSLVYSVSPEPPAGAPPLPKMYIRGEEVMALPLAERTELVAGTQQLGARCLCQLVPLICAENSAHLDPALVPPDTPSPVESLMSVIKFHMDSNSYHQHRGCLMLLYELALFLANPNPAGGEKLVPLVSPPVHVGPTSGNEATDSPTDSAAGDDWLIAEIRTALQDQILIPLANPVPPNYDEIVLKVSELNGLCRQMVDGWAAAGVLDVPEPPANSIFSVDQALTLFNLAPNIMHDRSTGSRGTGEAAKDGGSPHKYAHELAKDIKYVHVTARAWLAAVAVKYEMTPFLTNNSFVRPLFDAVKIVHGHVRDMAADVMVQYILQGGDSLKFVPRFVNNLLIFLSDDARKTPADIRMLKDTPSAIMCSMESIVLPSEKAEKSITKTATGGQLHNLIVDDFVYQRGAEVLLRKIALASTDLKSDFPDLYQLLMIPPNPDIGNRRLLQQLQLLESIAPYLDASSEVFSPIFLGQMAASLRLLMTSDLPTVRHMACRALVAICHRDPVKGLGMVLSMIVELCSATELKSAEKCGVTELTALLVRRMEHKLIGYLPLFALDLLRLMSDPVQTVRDTAADSFAAVVALLPLEIGTACPAHLTPNLKERREMQMRFIEQLIGGDVKSSDVKLELPAQISIQLRRYQEEGIRWMRFLNQFNLHGILADDMGLGKTAMTLVAVLMSHRNLIGRSGDIPGSEVKSLKMCSSLIIAPASVVGHWAAECDRLFVDNQKPSVLYLRTLREAKDAKREDLESHELVFTSYDDVRKNPHNFTQPHWHYVVLDEGHVIKNPKSELFLTVTGLMADHRLILTGTPIQNSVVELWSAFRFLMPGYLGSQKTFNSTYTRPIEKTKSTKVTEADLAAGQKSLGLLHKRVLPFVLRRLKTNVLADLPPKIIQDFYCDLAPAQRTLYEDYLAKCQEKAGDPDPKARVNPLNMLRYLRKLCDHPYLVDPSSPKSVSESGKFLALREILHECGIGVDLGGSGSGRGTGGVEGGDLMVCAPHRALIFCQFKPVVQLLEELMEAGQFGPLCWDKLDGSVPPAQRQGIVERFNSDPSVDLLLLTTQVGGLGLSLTAADVVIFLDQDWNPAKDLQAMDRAHRLGQTRTVTVYRILARDTIEQRV